MGCGALQGLTAAAREVTDQGTHRDKILPPLHLVKNLPCTLQWWEWIYFGLTTVPRRTFQQTQGHELCMFYTHCAYSCWSGDCEIWCIVILISQCCFLSLHLHDLTPLRASGLAPFTPCLLGLSSAYVKTPLMLVCAVFQHWKCNFSVLSKPEYPRYLTDINEMVWAMQVELKCICLLIGTGKKGRKTPQLWGESNNQHFRLLLSTPII